MYYFILEMLKVMSAFIWNFIQCSKLVISERQDCVFTIKIIILGIIIKLSGIIKYDKSLQNNE